jgi:hypothetical protein
VVATATTVAIAGSVMGGSYATAICNSCTIIGSELTLTTIQLSQPHRYVG